ncbi:hypothetical protein P43SY_008696 [Pythium insidiosum]|uniref:Uncharacterized protein n=1 Tax=Pythium insidiosum TaxID=114742 RepID=A0AAD5M5Z7_PYTIN|nr:hypothetical protein P43SY_008696 [Pythium insidiosum]
MASTALLVEPLSAVPATPAVASPAAEQAPQEALAGASPSTTADAAASTTATVEPPAERTAEAADSSAGASAVETPEAPHAAPTEPPTDDAAGATKSSPSCRTRPEEDDARALAHARRRLEIQIAFVQNARQKILDETHPDFTARLQAITAEREHLLELAAMKEKYLQQCTAIIFAYECDEANSEFDLHCDKLRQEMLEEIQHEIEIVQEQRKGNASGARKTTRKTRSARTKSGSDSEKSATQDAAQKTKKRIGNVFQPLEKKLAQSEVDQDLRELTHSLETMTKKRRIDATTPGGDLPCTAKYHRASLLYREAIFQEGDQVCVRNAMTNSEYIAIICSITSTEVFVLSEKGRYHRLVLMDLRQGRVVLSALTPEQNAALTEREAMLNL